MGQFCVPLTGKFGKHPRLANGPSLSPAWPAPGFSYFFEWPRLWGLKENFILNHCYMTVKAFLILKCLVTTGFIFYTHHFLAKKLNKQTDASLSPCLSFGFGPQTIQCFLHHLLVL